MLLQQFMIADTDVYIPVDEFVTVMYSVPNASQDLTLSNATIGLGPFGQ